MIKKVTDSPIGVGNSATRMSSNEHMRACGHECKCICNICGGGFITSAVVKNTTMFTAHPVISLRLRGACRPHMTLHKKCAGTLAAMLSAFTEDMSAHETALIQKQLIFTDAVTEDEQS